MGLKDGPKMNESGLELQPLQRGTLFQHSFFGYGSEPECWNSINTEELCPRLRTLAKKLQWLESLSESDPKKIEEWFEKRKVDAAAEATLAGMVKGTPQWKTRWHK
jgi:hypothetical protein